MSGKNHIEKALLEQYILGLTSEQESKQVELYLAQNPSVAKEVSASQAEMEDFAMEYAMEPPVQLRARIMEEVKSTTSPLPKTQPGMNFNWLTGLAAIFALGFGLMTFLLYQQQSKMSNQMIVLENKVDQLQNQNELLNRQKKQVNQQFAVLKDVKTNHVHLRGSKLSPKALIVVYWNETDQNAYLNIVDLPKIPTDKSLQLWADVDGEMIDMGVIDIDKKELLAIPFIPNAASLNITLEQKGGNDHPNVEQIYANGKLL